MFPLSHSPTQISHRPAWDQSQTSSVRCQEHPEPWHRLVW